MRGGLLAVREDSRALHHDVDPQVLPGQLLGVALGQHLDRPGTDIDAVGLGLDGSGKRAVHRVVLEEVRVVLGRDQVVDGHDLDVVALGLGDGTQHVAADAAEAGNCNAGGHGSASRMVWLAMTRDFGPLLGRSARACQCGARRHR
jgi:hypothetical protein